MGVAGRNADAAMIRFPDGMREELKSLAQANYRSMNGEVILRLRRDIDREKAASGASQG